MRRAWWIAFYGSAIGTVVVLAIIRFKNPTFTETQLFIQFWWVYLLLAGVCLALLWLADRGNGVA